MNIKFLGSVPTLSVEYPAFQKMVYVQKQSASNVVLFLVGSINKKGSIIISDIVIPFQQTSHFTPIILDKTFERKDWVLEEGQSVIGMMLLTVLKVNPAPEGSTFSITQQTFIETIMNSVFSDYLGDFLVVGHLYLNNEKSLMKADVRSALDSVVFEDVQTTIFMNFEKNAELKNMISANIFSPVLGNSSPTYPTKTDGYEVPRYTGNVKEAKSLAKIVEKNPNIDEVV